MHLGNESVFKSDVEVDGAKIGGDFTANDRTSVEGQLYAEDIKVGGSFFLNENSVFKSSVNLSRARIGENLLANGSSLFEGHFNASGVDVGSSLLLGDSSFFKGEVDLSRAKIGGNIVATNGAIFFGLFRADGVNVNGNIYLREGSEFKSGIYLVGARIGETLQFLSSKFDKDIDLTNVVIGDDLVLSNISGGRPIWGKDLRLILRNASARALQAELQAWHFENNGKPIPANLSGFRYEQIGGLGIEAPSENATNMSDASAKQLIDWIEGRDEDGKRNPAHDAIFTPQPYSALADALDKAGADQIAREIRFARSEHHRYAANTSNWDKFWLYGSKIFIGYGVYPFRILGWFAFLIGAGIVVAHFSKCESLRGFFPKLWFSAENAFPLIETRDRFKGLDHCNSTVETLFHLQKLFGFILATVLVGALTLLGG